MVSSSSSGATTGKSRGGGGGGELAVKKGPWTTTEDAILIEYVKKHGEGNWNAVQRNSGLLRCGKSCRLRWANHLRPNLKKGAFSAEEERLIIELHAKHGNKWARMASQLPGRTDNEIKNYWNTRVKRLQRAGLPIYPSDIPQQHDQPQFQPRQQQYHPKLSPPLSLFTPFNFQTIANPLQHRTNSSFLSNPNHQFNHFPKNSSIGRSTLPLPSSALPSSLFNHPFSSELFLINPFGLVHSMETELPSIQPPVLGMNTTDSSGSTGDDHMLKSSSDVDDEYCVKPQVANSGLLEALLEESKALVQSENLKKEITLEAGEDNDKMISVSCTGFTEVHHSSSADSSINGVKANEPLEEMNPIDDDLSSLLNNFPLTVPVPDWYDSSANSSNGSQSSNINDDNSGLNNLLDATPVETTMETTNQKWSIGSCCWNNMPGIC